jgi:HPt (histidine-containing phosphotransfer) domain-containing protein
MSKPHTGKSQRSRERTAFMQQITAACDPLSGNCGGAPAGARNRIRDGGAGIAVTARPFDSLASELFARLLLELPDHRRELLLAYQDGDDARLARAAHKLLGGVVYCELAELAAALRDLKQALGAGDTGHTSAALNKVIRIIDELLTCSGYGGT